MVCHRNQFGYRLFFLPLPADIFSSVFHSLNSIKKPACCYFKLLYLSFEQFIFKQWAIYPKFNPSAFSQDLNSACTTILLLFSGRSVIMVKDPIYLIFKGIDGYNSSSPKAIINNAVYLSVLIHCVFKCFILSSSHVLTCTSVTVVLFC